MLITVPQDESDGLIIANINESRFHCELLPVLGQVELFTDSVQGRSHFRKGPGGGILTLVPDPDNWNAPACFSLCYFCLTHLVVHWISIFVSHNHWQHPWILIIEDDTCYCPVPTDFQPASQFSESGRAVPPKMFDHCRRTQEAPQTLPPCTPGKHAHIFSLQRHQRPTVATEITGACQLLSLASTPGLCAHLDSPQAGNSNLAIQPTMRPCRSCPPQPCQLRRA